MPQVGLTRCTKVRMDVHRAKLKTVVCVIHVRYHEFRVQSAVRTILFLRFKVPIEFIIDSKMVIFRLTNAD